MKKSFFMLLLFITTSYLAFCQTIQFVNYKVNDFGTISIPTNLELQSGIYKQKAEAFQISMGNIDYEILDRRAVFQQKGVNSGHKTDTYARVIIQTYIGNYGDFDTQINPTPPSQTELYKLDEILKSENEESLKGTRLTLLNWYGTEWVRFNKYYALKVSYLRKLQGKPPVYVETYRIQNNDRLHVIIMSYRKEDQYIWRLLYKKIRDRIKINIIY